MRVKVTYDPLTPEAQALLDKVRPMSKRIIITRPKLQDRKSGNIVIPDAARADRAEFGLQARVLKRADDVDPTIAVGDTVVIPEFAGVPMAVEDRVPFWMVGEGDVMAVVSAT